MRMDFAGFGLCVRARNMFHKHCGVASYVGEYTMTYYHNNSFYIRLRFNGRP